MYPFVPNIDIYIYIYIYIYILLLDVAHYANAFMEVVLDLLLLNTIILPTSTKHVNLKIEIIQIFYRTALMWLYAIQRCADPENDDVPMSCSLQALRLWMIRIFLCLYDLRLIC